MSVSRPDPQAAPRRFEVALLIGPCTESESEDFLVAVVGFAENYAEASGVALGAVGAIHPWTEETSESEQEWNRAYDEAMQGRDWQTCEILMDEREQADWWKERDRDA